ncbi:MAG: nucleotidyltransferase family protein [Candidatus Riflebacteria bacterium]|nr:nucleotidyltransferase family protein [Candidatus Riflebacteria bacterium]
MPGRSKSRHINTGELRINETDRTAICMADELLLGCLSMAPDASNQKDNVSLDGLTSSDWEECLRHAAMHGLLPLVYHRLKSLNPDISISGQTINDLRQSYLATAARNMALYNKLGKILSLFSNRHIPVIALKGAHLAELVYCDIGLRSMNDIDLLVHKEDLVRAEETLFDLGYAPIEFQRKVSTDNYHFTYALPNKELCVEIHWTLLPPLFHFNLTMSEQWKRAQPALIAGYPASILCPEDLLVYLCLHTCKDSFIHGLRSLFDICITIDHYKEAIDWDMVVFHTCHGKMGKCVYLVLFLARELLGASVPDTALYAVKPENFDEYYIPSAIRQIFGVQHYKSDVLSSHPNIARLWNSGGVMNKAALILARIFPSSESMARMYPAGSDSKRIYLYYPLRIIDLILRHTHKMLRLLRGNKELLVAAKQKNEGISLKNWLMSP